MLTNYPIYIGLFRNSFQKGRSFSFRCFSEFVNKVVFHNFRKMKFDKKSLQNLIKFGILFEKMKNHGKISFFLGNMTDWRFPLHILFPNELKFLFLFLEIIQLSIARTVDVKRIRFGLSMNKCVYQMQWKGKVCSLFGTVVVFHTCVVYRHYLFATAEPSAQR